MAVNFTLERIKGEFLEMPGLRLTLAQAQRMWRIDASACRTMLDALVANGFLCVKRDGSYVRVSDGADVPSGTMPDDRDGMDLMLSAARPTTLVEGPLVTLAALLDDVAQQLEAPIVVWDGGALTVAGTVIIDHVEQLSAGEQQTLLEALARRSSGVQVIALASSPVPLFELVRRGRFSEVLYYRLNVVRVAEGAGGQLPEGTRT